MSATTSAEAAPQTPEPAPAEATVKAPRDPAKLRFAIKTALALTLAFIFPMAMGWPQPQTAAITVMLIAATGSVSESLQKGALRVFGTVIGAVIGLTLIAVFPQDRMLYLLAASISASFTIYLYAAYQGDNTLFMLTAVVTLMVFNGGDAEGAFIYGVDRAFMTVVGVLIYTIVGSLLWPAKLQDNTVELAASLTGLFHQAFEKLTTEGAQTRSEEEIDTLLAELIAAENNFQANFNTVKNDSDAVKAYMTEWNAITARFENLEALLVPTLLAPDGDEPDYPQYFSNYQQVLQHCKNLFLQVSNNWQQTGGEHSLKPIALEYDSDKLLKSEQLLVAAVASRGRLLHKIQVELLELSAAIDSLTTNRGQFDHSARPQAKPAFILLDQENIKTGLRAFTTFWVAAAIWILFNPPGGFTFVALSTILIPLASYTPAKPKVLVILLSLGFFFALPAYVFLLPQLTHWLELALFIFAYAFVGFFFLPGPVSIFFLLGLFILGIQNTMFYHFGVLLQIVLMFYMICGVLMITTTIPFTSKPEALYRSFRQRFFNNCGDLIRRGPGNDGKTSRGNTRRLVTGHALVTKMKTWGGRIDSSYFAGCEQENIVRFNRACEVLQGQLRVLLGSQQQFADNPIVARLRTVHSGEQMAQLCYTLATASETSDIDRTFKNAEATLAEVETELNNYLGQGVLDGERNEAIAEFYTYINLQHALFHSLERCRVSFSNLDWQQLKDTRFP
jgi:uncharacterized membrane protein YccC